MSEDADIEILPPQDANPSQAEFSKSERRIGLKTVGLGVILASLLGAGGGAMLSKIWQTPVADISPLMTNIQALETENKTLKAQISRLQRDVKALPKPAAIDVPEIKSRLKALESAKPQEIDSDVIARLEALNEQGSEALDLSDIMARLEALENKPAPIISSHITPSLLPAAELKPFPKAAVLAALESSQPSGGWLKRSLKKHIFIQSEENPHYLVELIIQNIEDGDVDAALSIFEKLPAEAIAAAQPWRDSLAN